MDFVNGEILAFDKPYRWTSFDVVGKVRWLLCKKLGVKKLKVGHSGTLDPLATGVVVVCTGKKTKLIEIPIPRAKKLLKLNRTSCFREEDLQKVDKWMAKNPKLALYWGTIR